MTKRQSEVLEYIKGFIAERSYSPTLRQIGDGLGMKSYATIHKHLKNLQAQGRISRDYNRQGITICEVCPRCGAKPERKDIDSVPRGTFSDEAAQ